MSDQNDAPEKAEKNSNPILIGLVAVMLIAAGVSLYMNLTSQPEIAGKIEAEKALENQVDVVNVDDENTAEEQFDEEGTPINTAATEDEAPASQSEDVALDMERILKDRILGDPKAPVRISEHSSLTCGHCGNFHRSTYPEIKKNYIDTGKAYIVFSDFPLNAPALHATLTARCLPEDADYFDFVQTLFEEQDQWAYDVSYLTYLRGKAKEYGLSEAKFEACLQNVEIQEGLVKKLQAAKAQWNISSTPTFVFNNKRVVSGALPPEKFSSIIEEEMAGGSEDSGAEPEETSAEEPAAEPPQAQENPS